MKKLAIFLTLICLVLAGCSTETTPTTTEAPVESIPEENVEASTETNTVNPLPDETMENLTDAILSVSFGEGDAYVDDSGIMQMDLKIYSYDKYDMVDVANLKVGDIIVTHSGEVEIASIETSENGTVCINGGLENGGFSLVTDESGVYFETGFDDAKNWYEIGEATIRVSADFIGTDNIDPDAGEVVLYPGSFLTGEVTNYDFTPYNTTIRVEEGQIVELVRIFNP